MRLQRSRGVQLREGFDLEAGKRSKDSGVKLVCFETTNSGNISFLFLNKT